ncbi:hypothetical protein COU60_03145 [Candidatus Pacearchaeota archaeon CG10_big_fil_rev_8_21_14_0_10_34_76]|nr:MAG: hypothetical protein COU60_03145 [Candidatus Pacearchaeota archaeon CG10_big_fil_rev_8_21_14_0_10_34_76]
MKREVLHSLAILCLVLLMTSLASSQETGSISGSVIPAEEDIKVQAIQNLSLVAETFTDENGNYVIEGLSPGNYGLVFIKDEKAYVYNDEINSILTRWENDRIIVTIKEPIISNSSDININLDKELPDYALRRITIQFKENVSEEQIEEVIASCRCELLEIDEKSYGTYYKLNAPEEEFLFKIIKDLNMNENVEAAGELAVDLSLGKGKKKNTTQNSNKIEDMKENRNYVLIGILILGLIIFLAHIIFRRKRKT